MLILNWQMDFLFFCFTADSFVLFFVCTRYIPCRLCPQTTILCALTPSYSPSWLKNNRTEVDYQLNNLNSAILSLRVSNIQHSVDLRVSCFRCCCCVTQLLSCPGSYLELLQDIHVIKTQEQFPTLLGKGFRIFLDLFSFLWWSRKPR